MAYVLAAVLRGMMVGLGVLVATVWFVPVEVVAPGWIVIFALVAGGVMGALGMVAGIWSYNFV